MAEAEQGLTQADLLKMKNEIIEAVSKIIKESSAELEKHINDVNDVKFKSVNDSLERHAKYHDDHFQEQKDLDEKITRSRESILKDVDDKLTKNSGTARSNVSMLIAGAAVILTIIGLFIGLFR